MNNLQNSFTKQEFLDVVNLFPTLTKMERVLIGEIEEIMQDWAEKRRTEKEVSGKSNQVHRGLSERSCLFRSFVWLNKKKKKQYITFNAGFGFWKTKEGRKHHLYVDFFIPRDENNAKHMIYAKQLKKDLPSDFKIKEYKNFEHSDFCRVYDECHLDKFLEEKDNEFHIETMKKWLKERIQQAERATF